MPSFKDGVGIVKRWSTASFSEVVTFLVKLLETVEYDKVPVKALLARACRSKFYGLETFVINVRLLRLELLFEVWLPITMA